MLLKFFLILFNSIPFFLMCKVCQCNHYIASTIKRMQSDKLDTTADLRHPTGPVLKWLLDFSLTVKIKSHRKQKRYSPHAKDCTVIFISLFIEKMWFSVTYLCIVKVQTFAFSTGVTPFCSILQKIVKGILKICTIKKNMTDSHNL